MSESHAMNKVHSILDLELEVPIFIDLLNKLFCHFIVKLFHWNLVQDKGFKLPSVDQNLRSFIHRENGSLGDGPCKSCRFKPIINVRDHLYCELDFYSVANSIDNKPCDVIQVVRISLKEFFYCLFMPFTHLFQNKLTKSHIWISGAFENTPKLFIPHHHSPKIFPFSNIYYNHCCSWATIEKCDIFRIDMCWLTLFELS